MSDTPETVQLPAKIENNTARVIALPFTKSFPNGIKLIPGLNTVPMSYLEELRDRAVLTELEDGTKGPKRYPGRELLEQLKEPVQVWRRPTPGGPMQMVISPQITIFEDQQVGREDGPPAPHSLKGMKPEHALALIKVTSDRKVLKRWAGESNGEVSQAAAAKLAGAV